MCRGQVFATDFIVALSIFLFVLALALVLSNNVNVRASVIEEYNELEEASFNAVNQLILSGGEPINWNQFSDLNEVNSLGLAESRNVLDKNKVEWLVDNNALQYNGVKELLGLSKYELRISLQDLNGTELNKIGMDADENKQIISVERYVLYDGNLCKIRIGVIE